MTATEGNGGRRGATKKMCTLGKQELHTEADILISDIRAKVLLQNIQF